ncbi:MAG: hypothetical protein IJH32_08580 [Ruminococcus sp.]|nr:hypothetical protein [Ruminococcus sp.]
MTQMETIARAQMYLEKLANGVNPLTDEEVGESDVINNVRISRCLFYASGILKQIVENKGKFKVERPDRKPFTITPEQLARFEYADYGISITEFTKRINTLIDTVHINELKSKVILEWLVEAGLLTNIIVNNKTRRRPTPQGESMGIFTEERSGQYGTYEGVFYSPKAQHFIVDNIGEIIASSNREKK